MRLITGALIPAILVCACSSVPDRKRERLAAYEELPAPTKALIDSGHIEAGMDTNAVYIAWGPPTAVSESTGPKGSQSVWIYSGTRAVHVPNWSYTPEPKGYGTVDYVPDHYSGKYPKAQVLFQDGRVVAFKKF